MGDPRREPISVGTLSIRPGDAPERWEVSGDGAGAERNGGSTVDAEWGAWVRLATRILHADALSRDLEVRGDAWDQGHAAGARVSEIGRGDDGVATNPYR